MIGSVRSRRAGEDAPPGRETRRGEAGPGVGRGRLRHAGDVVALCCGEGGRARVN